MAPAGWHGESWSHLDYEIGQMSTCVLLWVAAEEGLISFPVAVENALADSMLSHARSLDDFVSREPRENRLDPRAIVPDWQFTPIVEAVTKKRMHEEIAHLTHTRRLVDGRFSRKWTTDAIIPPLLERLETFYRLAGRQMPWTADAVLALHRAPPDAKGKDVVAEWQWRTILQTKAPANAERSAPPAAVT